jgi:hypothetical protein
MRTDALNRISRNANAPGAGKKQTGGRAQQAALRNLRNALGIYVIESNPTGALAYSVGGATPATITIELGTPTSTVIATNELDTVTWLGAGLRSLSVQVGSELAGNAKVDVV